MERVAAEKVGEVERVGRVVRVVEMEEMEVKVMVGDHKMPFQ